MCCWHTTLCTIWRRPSHAIFREQVLFCLELSLNQCLPCQRRWCWNIASHRNSCWVPLSSKSRGDSATSNTSCPDTSSTSWRKGPQGHHNAMVPRVTVANGQWNHTATLGTLVKTMEPFSSPQIRRLSIDVHPQNLVFGSNSLIVLSNQLSPLP